MTLRMATTLAGAFAVMANMAGTAGGASSDITTQYSATDTYEIIDYGWASLSGGGRLLPCTLDAQGQIQCSGPTFSQKTESISALLYNKDHGGLVQCHFAKVSTDKKDAAVFAQYDPQLYVDVNKNAPFYYAESVADILRPTKTGVQNGEKTFGSCVPFETPASAKQIEAIRSHKLAVGKTEYSLGYSGVNWPQPGGAFGAAYAYADWMREDRLFKLYKKAHDAGSKELERVKLDIFGNGSQIDHYIHANAPACDNTGDYSVAEAIKTAELNGQKDVVGVMLRSNCPAP